MSTQSDNPNAGTHTAKAGQEQKKKKTLANIKSPVIDAVIHGRYSFSTQATAQEKLDQLEERFVRSSLADSVDESEATVLWIRGYDLTDEEKKQGCVGNYAVIKVEETPDGKFAIQARKLPIEVARHPQRKRQKGKHPDWGYWVLRRVKKGWRYNSIEEAYSDLMKLVEDFPEVSIPAQNQIYTIIYRKMPDDSLPLFRVILEVEPLPEGGFTITCRENTFKRDQKPKKQEAPSPQGDEQQQVGRFTSMVMVKRNKRKNINEALSESSDKDGGESET
jgi:hypothetical protein